MNTPEILHIAYPLAAGLLGGLAYFAILAQAARKLAAGAPATITILLLAARAAIAILLFWTVAQFGLAALLWTLAGFQIGRLVLQRFAAVRP